MKEAHAFQRIASYFIDIIVVAIICSIITIGIPRSTKYNEATKDITSLLDRYFSSEIDSDDAVKELYENKYIVDKESIPTNLITIVVTLGYFVAFAYYNKGQTIGKKVMHIRIVSSEDKEVNYVQMLIRGLIFNGCILSIASVITIMLIKPSQYFSTVGVMGYAQFFLVICSFIMIVCRKDKRGLHDLLCRTKVVEC